MHLGAEFGLKVGAREECVGIGAEEEEEQGENEGRGEEDLVRGFKVG